MARLASISIGGYYPTPPHLIPRITPLLEPCFDSNAKITFLDPCAGNGEAVLTLIKAWTKISNADLYAAEMEATRAETLKKSCSELDYSLSRNIIHGDAFRIACESNGVSVLFLNPPYDIDKTYGRLENKFLTRFTPTLSEGGVLIYIVPYYALKASVNFIASEYDKVQCFRFPKDDFEVFKQIVLFAHKTGTRLSPDPELCLKIKTWAEDPSSLKELPHIGSKSFGGIPRLDRYYYGFSKWTLKSIDITALTQKIQPWVQTKGGTYSPIHGILPDLPIQELLLRKYPVATPPRPAHIAVGIASGIFNGSRIESTEKSLPPLLIKGVFDKEYKTIEEKRNKNGVVTSVVQVQQPKLVTTVLDLNTHKYHVLKADDNTDADIENLTVAGLLKHYSQSLMQVMEQQCPILYDPRKDGKTVTLAKTDRKLFVAQEHVSKALVHLLGGPNIPLNKRRKKSAILLGEIGSGKTSCVLAVGETIGAKRPLVVCPPHLLTSWSQEIASVLPWAKIKILESITDLEELANAKDDLIITLLSRETAKLSHGWRGVNLVCPKCGALVPPEDLVKKRSRCDARHIQVIGTLARTVMKLANQLVKYAPSDTTIYTLLYSPWGRKRIYHYQKSTVKWLFPGFSPTYFDETILELLARYEDDHVLIAKALVWILLSLDNQEYIAQVAEHLIGLNHHLGQEFGRNLLLMLKPNSDLQRKIVAKYATESSYWSPWANFNHLVEEVQKEDPYVKVAEIPISWFNGVLKIGGDIQAKSLEAAKAVLETLAHVCHFTRTEPCEEPLFCAVPEPRRIALAKYIQKNTPKLFDFLIIDECHEYNSDGSAQARAAHRLISLGMPTILMTGSVMNGYAESLFANMWAVSPDFRKEFNYNEKQKFNDRYGYRKRILTDKDSGGNIIEFGSMTDRITQERVAGNAPGVLPLFLLRHLLPISATLHKADLVLDLPPCHQEKCLIEPGEEITKRFKRLQRIIVDQIKRDQFIPERSGKLFGQLAELPSYLDRATADTGNTENGDYEIRYPESIGSELVTYQEALDANTVLPKEQWLLETVEREINEGRNVLVFSWHVNLLPRLARLISNAIDIHVPILYADKVPTGKRQDWITKQVVAKNARVMVTNPVAIQTGLNNLIHFSTEIWMENPACNPIIFRQAIGRIDRIGQTKETKILCPLYVDTLQEQLHELLLRKVAISISTDGLDPESALLAAGVGVEDILAGLSIGKQLWAMLSEGVYHSEKPTWKKIQHYQESDIISLIESV